ncbi:hypothetical protein L195_g064382, partial [Trifolium pratense]
QTLIPIVGAAEAKIGLVHWHKLQAQQACLQSQACARCRDTGKLKGAQARA